MRRIGLSVTNARNKENKDESSSVNVSFRAACAQDATRDAQRTWVRSNEARGPMMWALGST
jgi:hypothetical protein